MDTGTPSPSPKVIRDRTKKLPPPPPGVRYVPVPLLGLVIADDDTRHRIDRFFHWPMIVVAIVFLPLLLVEFLYLNQLRTVDEKTTTEMIIYWGAIVGLAGVWLAFLIEFIVKIAIAESRFEYVRRNWLDVIIILVPVLRPLRIASLAKTSRVFTLRGVGMKMLRYCITIVVGLEATNRMLERVGVRRKDGRTDPRDMTRHQLMHEVLQLRRQLDRWEQWHTATKTFHDAHPSADLPPPPEPDDVDDEHAGDPTQTPTTPAAETAPQSQTHEPGESSARPA